MLPPLVFDTPIEIEIDENYWLTVIGLAFKEKNP